MVTRCVENHVIPDAVRDVGGSLIKVSVRDVDCFDPKAFDQW